jgi:hypothetical protein
VSQFELEEIARESQHDDRFLQFLRYIEMLDESDPKKAEGKKFILMIFKLDKFQAYQNQSLNILDYESQIYEEPEAVEGEGIHAVHSGIQFIQAKS